jgi:hypothetical protein
MERTMKRHRPSIFADATAVDRRGHGRTRTVELLISERNALIRAAVKFFPGLSGREVARRLHVALLRYQTGRWRRTSSEWKCPHDAERLDAVLWSILRVKDHTPSISTIRRALGVVVSHEG